jgi:tetratricopeptide (TPR) repeat protein/transcriptional regulator with XRE-family HTH domain
MSTVQLPSRSRKDHPLRTERLQHHWSQRELAEHVGATVATVKRWERQTTVPSPYFRLKLMALFGKSEEELWLGGVNSLPSPSPERAASGEGEMSSFPIDSPALWTVPYRRNPYFTGRDELLHLLDQHFSAASQKDLTTTRPVALTQPQAIKGLGGIGKTQIAVEYAYRAREQGHYIHTLWINAANEEAMMTSFTTLAEVLPDFPAQNETDQQKLVAAIKCWLEQCQERWLLIFDNADDLSLVQEYVPQQGNGSILLTTRANAVGSLAASIDVEKMGFIEGTHLLLHRAQRYAQASDDEVNEAGNIVVALDHFPLALEQAGAYIEETECSFGHYLQLYHNHRNALLARRGAQATNYPDSVATTWSLSFQKVEQAHPAAAELLHLCAFLAPDHIPEELLTNGAPHWPPVLQQAAADPFAFDQMLEALLAFSLVKRLAENHLLSIHRLVQAVQLDRMDPEEQRQWAERAVSAVNAVFPRDPKNEIATWPQCLRYLEQAQACDTLIQRWKLTLTEAGDLLHRIGNYLSEHASYALAESLYQHALSIREQQLGSEHPDVATTLNDLAVLYRHQGKYEQVEPLYLRALSIREQQLGLHHLETARSLNNLAILYWNQGKYEQAEPLYLRVLSIREQQLGLHHPETARCLDNLAILYQSQGKYEQAEPLYLRALSIREQQLGREHPDTANTLNNLAELYHEQGKYAEAEPLFQRALHIWEQSLGPEHPQVAHALRGLAKLYRKQGKHAEAERLFQHALSIHEHALEPYHPDIAETLYGFATLREAQGQNEQATSLYGRALMIREKVYGPEHPKTTGIRERLAVLDRTEGIVALSTRQPEQGE